jgi:hypothetical protein
VELEEAIMTAILFAAALAAVSNPVSFERHEIDAFPKGYQVAVADMNADGKPDVLAVSPDANRTDWYENPSWTRHPVAQLDRSLDVAPHDLDGDGRPEIALISGFYFGDSSRGGDIQWLERPDKPEAMWRIHPIDVDPVVHRIRWGNLDGDGRPALVHAPIFGPGSRANVDTKPVHFRAYRVPANPRAQKWEPWEIDGTLTVLHGLFVADLDGDKRDEVLTASYEGVHRFDFEGAADGGRWTKRQIGPGAPPVDESPGARRGTSEVAATTRGRRSPLIAAIEPWHGDLLVVYTEAADGSGWRRRVIDDSLREGHALFFADMDGDSTDEIVAGWRRGDGGLALYDPLDAGGEHWAKSTIDTGIKVECAVAADINQDGRLDIVAIARASDQLVWYENRGR